jgi:hypothetical protein
MKIIPDTSANLFFIPLIPTPSNNLLDTFYTFNTPRPSAARLASYRPGL